MSSQKHLPSKMDGAPRNFKVALAALAAIFLRLGGAELIYAEKGSSPELPCPGEHGEVSWYLQQSGPTLLFSKRGNGPVTRLPEAWDRLRVLQNYSLQFSNVTDSDHGRYWCSSVNYYDLVVTTGTKQMLESRLSDLVCYVLSCSVSSKELGNNVVSWWEGKKALQQGEKERDYSIFKGHRASQLHICLREGKETKERRLKCSFAEKQEIAFHLTGREQDSCGCCGWLPFPPGKVKGSLTPPCPESEGNGGTWIPLAVCVTLQSVIIFVLGLLLWRSCRQKHPAHLERLRKDVSKLDGTSQVYVNVRT
ncbi:lymphocyte antigen 6 complex locus protein G6f [Podarcis raffonei]|uniref:lymphocyte antigen 6 complex locus protein G6f n=1 Tax=Podarcis raffonei TaxID=65483 RepID=UPI0023292F1A|nr:lymphocyte antigen 6 complex locus protein G6f [Podarcis raffonei]